MSARVEQIIEILEEVRAHNRIDPGTVIKEARKNAVKEVAFRRGVDPKTVADKYIRWLNPPVERTGDFDQLVSDWLPHGSGRLQEILTSYSGSSHDRVRIALFFASADAPLAQRASDFDEPPDTARVRQEVYRILRDTACARAVKAAANIGVRSATTELHCLMVPITPRHTTFDLWDDLTTDQI